MELHERLEFGDVVLSRVGYVITVYRNDVKAGQMFLGNIGTAESTFKEMAEAYRWM